MSEERAIYSELPYFSGDGYSYGGGYIVTIGAKSIAFGEGFEARELAQEITRRWNAALQHEAKP